MCFCLFFRFFLGVAGARKRKPSGEVGERTKRARDERISEMCGGDTTSQMIFHMERHPEVIGPVLQAIAPSVVLPSPPAVAVNININIDSKSVTPIPLPVPQAAALMCDLRLAQRPWQLLHNYLPQVIPTRAKVIKWLRAREAAVVAEESNGIRMAGVSLMESIKIDLSWCERLRRSKTKTIKVGADGATDEKEKDGKKKTITCLVYCYVFEGIGRDNSTAVTIFFFFIYLFIYFFFF